VALVVFGNRLDGFREGFCHWRSPSGTERKRWRG
jgi:hypothetical protein